MFLVFNILPLTFSHPAFVNFFNNTFAKFSDLYMLANGATMGILALYFNLALGYEFTKIYAEEDDLNLSPLNGALLSMFAFFMTLPQLVFKDGAISLVNDAKATIVNGWAIGGSGVNLSLIHI